MIFNDNSKKESEKKRVNVKETSKVSIERPPTSRPTKSPKEFSMECYIIKDGDIFIAICENMSTFGQGKTPEAARKKLLESTTCFINHIFEEHPNDGETYISRPIPSGLLLEEYKSRIEDFVESISLT